MKKETRAKRELYPTPAFGILQIVLALPQYALAGCHFPGLECQNCLRTLLFFFFFYCFITRLTYQHTQSHMLTHILCIHRGMYLIHMHFILLRQIHLIPLLRTDSEYQQLPSNNLKGCSSERQRAGKSELRVQPHVTDSRYCLGTANGAVWYHEKPTSLPRKQPPGTHFLLRKPDAINT